MENSNLQNLASVDHRIKYLLEALKKEPNGLQKHEESELFLLLSQVRGIGSKWSNPDKIGQAELYEAINSVFNSLKNYTEHSGPFLKKVNAKEVPDYYQIITNPMDLSIISKRIKNTHYNSKKEFSDDLYLIYSNCLLYNTNPDNEYRKHAIAMREKTDALLQSVPDITILSREEFISQLKKETEQKSKSVNGIEGAQAIELYDDNSDSDSGCEVDEWDIRLRQEFKVPFLSPLPLLWDPEINNPNRNKLSDPDYDPTENAPTIDEYPEAQIPKTGTAPIIDQNIELLKQCHPKDLPPLEMNYETSSAVMKCCVAKLLQHSGFESSMNTPLHILTEIAGDYLMNIGRTFRKYLDDYDKKMKPEEIVEHVLYENGIGSLNDIESYLRDDICRYGTKLKDLRRRLDTAFNEQIINPDGSGGGANNSEKIIDETLLENEDVFVTGNIVEEVDEDFFRFKELGLGPLSVPMKLFHGTNKTKYPVKKVDNSLENKYSPPPPWKPITDSSSRIGLLQEFFQLKTEQHNGQLIEDEQLPPKQKFQRPKVPPTGKIPPQPRRQPQKSVAELAAALAEKKRKREKELELLEQKERQKKLKLQEKAKKQAEKEEQKKQKQLEREQAKKAELERKAELEVQKREKRQAEQKKKKLRIDEVVCDSNLCASAISQDGEWIAVSDITRVKLFRVVDDNMNDSGGLVVRKINFPKIDQEYIGAHHLLFTPDNRKLIVVLNDCRIIIFGLDISRRNNKIEILTQFKQIQNEQEKGSITSIAISNDSLWLACGDELNRIRIFNLEKLKYHSTLPIFSSKHASLTFDP
ncbi:20365_t:CDS:2, partial [Entrophospora sp. SA101]